MRECMHVHIRKMQLFIIVSAIALHSQMQTPASIHCVASEWGPEIHPMHYERRPLVHSKCGLSIYNIMRNALLYCVDPKNASCVFCEKISFAICNTKYSNIRNFHVII